MFEKEAIALNKTFPQHYLRCLQCLWQRWIACLRRVQGKKARWDVVVRLVFHLQRLLLHISHLPRPLKILQRQQRRRPRLYRIPRRQKLLRFLLIHALHLQLTFIGPQIVENVRVPGEWRLSGAVGERGLEETSLLDVDGVGVLWRCVEGKGSIGRTKLPFSDYISVVNLFLLDWRQRR